MSSEPTPSAAGLALGSRQVLGLGGVDLEHDTPLIDLLDFRSVDETVAAGEDGGVEHEPVEDVEVGCGEDVRHPPSSLPSLEYTAMPFSRAR